MVLPTRPDRPVSVDLLEKGVLLPGRALVLGYENPITGATETLRLCKLDLLGIGIYRKKPLEALRSAILNAREKFEASAQARAPSPPKSGCEECGAEPAHYVAYRYLVTFAILYYASASRRRVYCSKHLLGAVGLPYLVTTMLGWPGIGILSYPFVTWSLGRTLSPAIGKWSYLAALLPTLAVGSLIFLLFRLAGR